MEILGYITAYLLVGVLLLPFYMVFYKDCKGTKKRRHLYITVLSWPLSAPMMLIFILIFEWEDFKNYK